MAMQPLPMPQQAPVRQQQPNAPYSNQAQWSPEQLDQMKKTRLPKNRRMKESPAIVTSVLSDILVFAETQDIDDEPRCLSFRPNKIAGYKGELLQDIGIFPGALIATIVWDMETTIVQSVTVLLEGSAPVAAAGE